MSPEKAIYYGDTWIHISWGSLGKNGTLKKLELQTSQFGPTFAYNGLLPSSQMKSVPHLSISALCPDVTRIHPAVTLIHISASRYGIAGVPCFAYALINEPVIVHFTSGLCMTRYCAF